MLLLSLKPKVTGHVYRLLSIIELANCRINVCKIKISLDIKLACGEIPSLNSECGTMHMPFLN